LIEVGGLTVEAMTSIVKQLEIDGGIGSMDPVSVRVKKVWVERQLESAPVLTKRRWRRLAELLGAISPKV
jgi:formylmethanofuran dehydrogenase subunit B